MSFKASAPGSLMLLGEYAVLEGKCAVVCAIDKRITVILTPRQDQQICIRSALGEQTLSLSQLVDIKIQPPFQFVLKTLSMCRSFLKKGFDLDIHSEFLSTIGFASSAAVTVATLAALSAWLQLTWSQKKIIITARKIIRAVQGIGSGADAAACVMGGIIAYKAAPFWIKTFLASYPLTVIYSGSKTPTPVVIQHVQQYFSDVPSLYKHICRGIQLAAETGIKAIAAKDWEKMGKVMTIQQGFMDALGVNTDNLANALTFLKKYPTILGAKISGSGLGDCVVGLGDIPLDVENEQKENVIPVRITEEGVRCEKI